MPREPSSVGPVRFPVQYGTPGGPETLRPWSDVEARMRAAANYWITTVGPDARPHARPVDGVWVDGALCFGGSPETRWVRNLMANSAISVHLSSEAEAIILEGAAEYVRVDARRLPTRCDALALRQRVARRRPFTRVSAKFTDRTFSMARDSQVLVASAPQTLALTVHSDSNAERSAHPCPTSRAAEAKPG
jgi:hypothetical protein